MLLNKSFLLAANNWKVMLKALLCQVLILALAISVCFLFFGELAFDIVQAFSEVDFSGFIAETLESIGNGSFNIQTVSNRLGALLEQTKEAIETIPNVWNRVEVSYISFVIIVLVYRMLVSFSDIAVGFQLNEFMTSNAQRPFLWFIVKKFGESWQFVSLQMLLSLPLDLTIVAGGVGFWLLCVPTLKKWAIIPAVVIVLVLYTARQSYFAFWLPAAVSEGNGVRGSLKIGASTIPLRFGSVFWKNLLIISVMTVVSSLSVVYVKNTVLSLVLGIVPALILFFLLKCINLVEYFEATNRPYFYKKVDVEGTERFNKKMERKAKSKRNSN